MAAMAAFAVGGVGSALTVEAVQSVAKGSKVELDTAAAQRLKKAAPPPAQFQPEDAPQDMKAPTDATAAPLTTPQARAALLVRLHSLVAGSSRVRLAVLEALVAALNAAEPPALRGGMQASAVQVQLADVLAQQLPQGISAHERGALEAGQSSAAGVAALVVAAGAGALTAATAAAALSCEALQAQTKAFEEAAGEGQAYKAAAKVAGELRGLLEGSSQADPRKGGAGAVACFSSVPQVHGAAEAALAAARSSVRSELAAAAPAPEKLHLQPPPVQLVEDLLGLARRLAGVAAQSAVRCRLYAAAPEDMQQELEKGLKDARASIETCTRVLDDSLGGDACLGSALAAACALAALQGATSLECTLAMLSLRQQVPPSSSAAAPEADEQGSKKKERKKGKGGAALGKGTAVFRAFLEEQAAGPPSLEVAQLAVQNGAGPAEAPANPAQLRGTLQAVAAALDPTGAALPPALGALRALLEANAARRKPKIAKGTRDFLPAQMAIRGHAFRVIERAFERHGAVAIDTPVFELRETLTGKYGEDSKLIYDLADQGGEALSLRYDLTVPFARYVALNGLGNIKRYHIARVYRRDQPQAARGRFREFFQCDFDIAGAYPTMLPDAEVLAVVVEILGGLGLGGFCVKVNHRRLLDAMLRLCSVPPAKFRPICSAIDKLDKEPWAAVRAEMVDQKGLPPEVADRIQPFVEEAGAPAELLARLSAPGHALGADAEGAAALAEMRTLFELLGAMSAEALARVRFDLSLARGLDYYTGLIYEAVLVRDAGDEADASDNVGSIAAGGRYDGLVGMFSGKDVPAVGVSIGIERVFAILERKLQRQAAAAGASIRETQTQVLVASPGKGMQLERIKLASELWAADIAAEFGYKANPNFKEQLQAADDAGIPFVLVLGESELREGIVLVKNMWRKGEGDERGDAVQRAGLVAEMRERIRALGAERSLLSRPAV